MKYVWILVVVFLSACTSISQPSANKSALPSFNPHINPYQDSGEEYMRHFTYSANEFVEFYRAHYLVTSWQECYKNMPQLFLDEGEQPILIELADGKIPASFQKRFYTIFIGGSAFSQNTYPKPANAIEVAKALKAKYVFYEAKLLDTYGTMKGKQVQRKKVTAFFGVAVANEQRAHQVFAQKCPMLLEEIQAERDAKHKVEVK